MHEKVIIIILSAFIIQGCLLDRIEESRKQLCSGEIELSTDGSISLSFLNPTLYPKNIIKILGENPSRTYDLGIRRYFQYKVTRRKEISIEFDIPIEFEFIERDGRHHLSKTTAQKRINSVIPETLVKDIFYRACYAQLKGSKVIINFNDIALDELPNIEGIKDLLGEPHSVEKNLFTYFYDLNATETIKIEILYDIESDKLRATFITFFRYRIRVDFQEKVVIGELKDLATAFKLGFTIAIAP
jgi:hypothetical protein